MNDIIKVILLNFILIYFLIKKNKSVSMFLIVVLFMYLLYLRANKLLEGQSNIDEKKDEVKFMKMANLDRLLGKLLNVYEHSEEDCIGGYTDFTPCDKKCGITHKYKTYRVKRKAGLFGKSCVEEDGRRKKELCDESDGVYKCIIGESCQEDGDCETNNCDPKTNRCVPKKVCSNTNLDLCNKEECIDLNNHYDYAKREFKYDETEPGVKCKLEDKETDTDTEDEEEDDEELGTEYDPDKISLEQCDSEGNFWLYKDEDRTDTLTSVECKLKIPGSVYYADESDERLMRRNQIYGTSETEHQMGPGLYCKIGYQFDPDSGNNLKGVTLPIESGDLEDIESENPIPLTNYCNVKYYNNNNTNNYMNSHINNTEDEDSPVLCRHGQQWPPLKYFTDLNNLGKNEQDMIPITEMCGRCNNGSRFIDGNICVNCSDTTNNFNQWVQDEDGKYERPPGSNIPMGKNASCTVGAVSTTAQLSDTCENLKNNRSLSCNNAVFKPGAQSTAADFYRNCCTYCDNNQYFVASTGGDNGSCVECPAGRVQDTTNPSNPECTPCPDNTIRSIGQSECSPCTIHGQIPNIEKTQCGNYCGENYLHCVENQSSEFQDTNVYRCEENCCVDINQTTSRFPAGAPYPTLIPFGHCNTGSIPRKTIGDEYTLDFYDECCEFECPSEHYKSVTDSGIRYCEDCNDACGGLQNDRRPCKCTLNEDSRNCQTLEIRKDDGSVMYTLITIEMFPGDWITQNSARGDLQYHQINDQQNPGLQAGTGGFIISDTSGTSSSNKDRICNICGCDPEAYGRGELSKIRYGYVTENTESGQRIKYLGIGDLAGGYGGSYSPLYKLIQNMRDQEGTDIYNSVLSNTIQRTTDLISNCCHNVDAQR